MNLKKKKSTFKALLLDKIEIDQTRQDLNNEKIENINKL